MFLPVIYKRIRLEFLKINFVGMIKENKALYFW